jgi:hypothetical protein
MLVPMQPMHQAVQTQDLYHVVEDDQPYEEMIWIQYDRWKDDGDGNLMVIDPILL